MPNEATARIKINKLLEAAGWRFLDDSNGKANIRLEASATLTQTQIDALGNDFEHASNGKIDFLLLSEKGFPLIVLEAKRSGIEPLAAKEQARKYARSQNCRFVILSNGELHYFWDLDRGDPYQITAFPNPSSVQGYAKTVPNPQKLINENVGADFIALTQRAGYANDVDYKDAATREAYIRSSGLRFLREYQLKAVHALQEAVKNGKDRFLFVMATGTGKTLISAAVIKLFLKTGNASRVLFLVDRLELEDQAHKNFQTEGQYLKNDYTSVIYKENRDEWNKAEVVITTVQSLLHDNKFRRLFSPTDFDLIISDEAHRSIGGNARAVFEYFVGYKLGLTATPKDYLKNFAGAQGGEHETPDGERERRLYLDTYRTFGCADGTPTYQFGLEDGVRQGFLIRPTVVKTSTEVTTQLLAEQGFTVTYRDEQGAEVTETFEQQQFEKKFFSDSTNGLFCKTLLERGLVDPVTGEFGKTIVFAVSQKHAARLTNTLNVLARQRYPHKYNSDFAVQVTSSVPDAQQYTKNFASNNLMGNGNFNPYYKTSKARVCVTVGMMTTGYDCPDILNLALMRPIFSATEFVQIKGRGTRKHDHRTEAFDAHLKAEITDPHKSAYKLFDYFANCEYFENEFPYDEVLDLPQPSDDPKPTPPPPPPTGGHYQHTEEDVLISIAEVEYVGGMKIDKHFFKSFADAAREDPTLAAAVEAGRWDDVIRYVNDNLLNKPSANYTIEKLRRAVGVDRRAGLREILEYVFGLIPRLKSKDELLEEEFATFVADRKLSDAAAVPAIKTFFKAYATHDDVRHIIDSKDFALLHTHSAFDFASFKKVPDEYRTIVPDYIKDNLSLNQFM